MGYQPTLADEMGELQERITSVRGRAITSMQAIYVPADDYTDPAPATTFAHLDATTNLERSISDKGIYPAVDPLASSSRILAPEFVGAEHYAVASEVKRILQRTRTCRTSSPSSVWTSCPKRTRSPVGRARRIERFLSQNTYAAKQFTGIEGSYVPIKDTVEAFKKIAEGEYDHFPEQAFFMCGGLEDLEAQGQGADGGIDARSHPVEADPASAGVASLRSGAGASRCPLRRQAARRSAGTRSWHDAHVGVLISATKRSRAPVFQSWARRMEMLVGKAGTDGGKRSFWRGVPRWARVCTAFGVVLMVLSGAVLVRHEVLLSRYEGAVGKGDLFGDQAAGAQQRKSNIKGPLNILLVGIDPRQPRDPAARGLDHDPARPGRDRPRLPLLAAPGSAGGHSPRSPRRTSREAPTS